MKEDAELLTRYTQGQDEQAFAELVTRHLNVVYSAALRHTDGDVDQAEEVAQSVFTDLARKASSLVGNLQQGLPLIGWLYTSTHFAASRVRRSEQRRQARETNAYTMNQVLAPAGADAEPEWSEIRPLLDEAMHELAQPDRDAVLLRYFSGQDLRSVGTVLGLSEDAARKRVDRAVDRLRIWLAGRGIKTTGAALAAVLVSQAVQVAPGGWATGVARTALSGSALEVPKVTSGSGFRTFVPGPITLTISATIALTILGALAFRASETPTSGNPLVGLEPAPSNQPPAASKPVNNVPPGIVKTAGKTAAPPETIRVPKEFLKRIPMMQVTMPNDDRRMFVPSEEFVKILKLTPSEIDQVTAGLAEALHLYRIEQGRHLMPTTEAIFDPFSQDEVGPILEAVSFRLVPFPEEARAIRLKLKATVLQALGNERTTLFFQSSFPGGSLLDGEMDGFVEDPAQPMAIPVSVTFTFRLRRWFKGHVVDLHQATVTHGGGGGAGGYEYGQPLDQYAPESLKPVLVRWRQWIAEHSPTQEPPAATGNPNPNAAGPGPVDPNSSSSGAAAPWDENATHVDLLKSLIASLGILGLTIDETVSPEAVELCQLTNLEADAVKSLYAGMKSRFMKMESDHFARNETNRNQFILRAFPTETAALQKEWNGQLKELLGESRGELLDQLIRTPPSVMNFEHQRMLAGMRDEPGVDWLHSGMDDIDVEIIRTDKHNGYQEPSLQYRSRAEAGIRGTFGPITGDRVPVRFRHLLTPEILKTR